MSRRGLFVTGTSTGVGKTVVAACLVRLFGADYWKPVQTGAGEHDDTDEVRRLTGGCRAFDPAYSFKAPLSPHEAARLEGAVIDMDRLVLPRTDASLIVEGAGGVLVPLNAKTLMIDLIARIGFPSVVVASSGLGTINHTLLSLEALRGRDLPIAGVVMNGPPNPANRHAIETYGRVRVLGELAPVDPLDAQAVIAMAEKFEGEGRWT